MKRLLLTSLAAGLLASAAQAQPTIEAVLDVTAGANSAWGAFALAPNTFVATPDSEAIAAANGRVFLQNGSDTSDGDGDGVLSFNPASPKTDFTFMVRGSANAADDGQSPTPFNLEFMLLNSGAFSTIRPGGEGFEGMVADAAGNVYIALLGAGGAAIVRIDASSDLNGTGSGSVLTSAVPGIVGLAINGNIIYALLHADSGATEDQVVSILADGGTGQVPTVVFTQAQLAAAGLGGLGLGGTSRVNGIETDGEYLFVSSRFGGIARLKLSDGTGNMMVTNADIAALFNPGEFTNRLADESVAFAAYNDLLYVATFDSDPLDPTLEFSDFYNIVCFNPNDPLATLSLFVTEADIETNPSYIADIAGGEIENQSRGLAVLGEWLYLSLEQGNSNTDSVVRARLTEPASVGSWELLSY